jgi:glycosyltransferase involved in cell wall biosynthesis
MKIAFISTFYPFRGGIAQFNAALYRALEKQHKVKAFNFSLQYPSLLFPGKTQLVSPEDNADAIPSERTLNSISPRSFRKTAKAIEHFQPDVLIIGYWMPFMAPSLGYVAKRLAKKCKVVSIVHNAIPHEKSRLDKVLSHYFFQRSNRFVALSESVRKDILKNYPTVKVQTILHPSYDHFGSLIRREAALNQLQLDPSNQYLLFFGLIRDYKGLDTLLQALALLAPDIHLLIAGEVYGSFTLYQRIIQDHQLETRVHQFNAYIPDHEVHLYFSAAACCVLPYKSATQSGITAIAHHFNIPVVASNVGGLSEFIQHDKNGYLVTNCTPKKLAQTLNTGFTTGAFEQFSVALSQQQHATWEDFAHELLAFI